MSRAGPVSRAASVCRDDFLPSITEGEPARLMANAITRKNLSSVSRDPGTAIPGCRLTGLSCNREVDFYGV